MITKMKQEVMHQSQLAIIFFSFSRASCTAGGSAGLLNLKHMVQGGRKKKERLYIYIYIEQNLFYISGHQT